MDGWREWSARKESCLFTAEVTEKGLGPEQGREKGDLMCFDLSVSTE